MRWNRIPIRHAVLACVLLLGMLRAMPARGDLAVSFTPEAPRVGEYVDVTVTTDADPVMIPEGDRPDAAFRSFQQPDPAARPAAEWPAGTEVILLDRAGDFCLAEGLGCRGWILGDRLAPDGAGR